MTWATTLSLSGRTVDGTGPALGMGSAWAPGEGSLDDGDHTPTPQAREHRCQGGQTRENSLLIRGREREESPRPCPLAGLRGERSEDKRSRAATQRGGARWP